MKKTRTRKFQILFFLATVFIYFFGLGRLPLIGPDEPRYAQVAREMFERGDWITPTLGGFNWFEKPALLYWLEIAAYKILGVNEFSARFGSAIFGLLTVFTVYLLCHFASRRPETNDEQQPTNDFADYAFLVMASTIGLLVFSRAASFDIILTFPITAALACFYVSQFTDSRHIPAFAPLFGFYFFIGVAVLAKGLIGFVLPFAIIFWYFAALRKFPSGAFLISLIWGILLSVLTASVWYAPMYLRHGWSFIDEFFIQHHFARYTTNKFAHPEPFWFFWAILPILVLPWTPFLFAAIWKFFNELRTTKNEQRTTEIQQHSLKVFALVWMIVPLVFFSFSGSKLPGYILPALPATAIFAADEVWRFAAKSDKRRLILQIVAIAVFTFVAAALLFVAPDFARRDTKKFLVQTAAERGFINEKVLNLHDISHSLEFYATGRTVRLENGKQRQFFGAGDIMEFMQQTGEQRVLVVVPLARLHELPEYNHFKTEIIADNSEYAIAAVSR
ncbi:MAG: glycosyltransferase family 39 protein [Acidobacteriota bacterium]|nr:glycosyltransferase family 39 protein [Acidobacteriota bacterium]